MRQPWAVVQVRMRDGSVLRGFARNQGRHDLQLQTLNGQFRLLVDTEYEQVTRERSALMPPLQASMRRLPAATPPLSCPWKPSVGPRRS